MTSRYGFQARTDWVPEAWVVVDRATGLIVSKHRTEDEARDVSKGLNVKKRGRF